MPGVEEVSGRIRRACCDGYTRAPGLPAQGSFAPRCNRGSAHSDCVTSLISGGKFVMRDRNVFGEKMILKGARTVLNEINYKQ